MSVSGATELPNPDTPLAFFPPEVAFQVEVSHYILIGTLGGLVWETLNTVRADYQLLTRCKINLSMIIYYISRVATFVFLLSMTIISTSPVKCHAFQVAMQVCYPIAVATTTLLFFFRVRAMFFRNRIIVAFFFMMWLGVAGGSIVPAVIAIQYSTLGPTRYCIGLSASISSVATNLWLPLANDTLIFVAITWRLVGNSVTDSATSVKTTVRNIFTGEGLSSFSRALLQDGQAYFMSTIIIPLISIIIFYNPSVPVVYRQIFPVPNVMIINIMATRIYRNTRLGIFRELNESSTTNVARLAGKKGSSIAFRPFSERLHVEPMVFGTCHPSSGSVNNEDAPVMIEIVKGPSDVEKAIVRSSLSHVSDKAQDVYRVL